KELRASCRVPYRRVTPLRRSPSKPTFGSYQHPAIRTECNTVSSIRLPADAQKFSVALALKVMPLPSARAGLALLQELLGSIDVVGPPFAVGELYVSEIRAVLFASESGSKLFLLAGDQDVADHQPEQEQGDRGKAHADQRPGRLP